MLRALRIRDFRLLWGAGVVSSLGSWLLALAVPAHVFLVTGSLSAAGFTLAAGYLPLLLFGPVAGVLTDRWDRRRLMAGCDIFRAAAVACMLPGLASGRFWVFYLALAAESSGTALFGPAQRACTPAIVGTGTALTGANALNAVTGAIVRLAGGPLGGILFAAFGIRTTIYADAVSYLVSAAAVLGISRPAGGQAGKAGRHRMTIRAARQDLADGLRTLRADAVARTLLPVTVLFLAANATLSAVVVPFGLRRLGGSTQTSLLFAALGAGFLVGAPVFRLLADRLEPRTLLAASLTATAASYFLLFRTSTLSQALPCAAANGLSGSLALAIPQTAVQRSVPGAALGRVSAAFLTAEAAATLTGAVAGPALAQVLQIPGVATVASLITMAAAVLTALRVPVVKGPVVKGIGPARPPGPSPARGRRRPRTRAGPGPLPRP